MTSAKIAVIEDDPAIGAMYEYKLQAEGYQVRRALNGEDGLRLADQWRPDLLLLDLKMPLMTGDEMLEKLRATDWGSSMRVIILTNISKTEAPMSLRFLNVDRYIVKAHHTPSQVTAIAEEILHKNRRVHHA